MRVSIIQTEGEWEAAYLGKVLVGECHKYDLATLKATFPDARFRDVRIGFFDDFDGSPFPERLAEIEERVAWNE